MSRRSSERRVRAALRFESLEPRLPLDGSVLATVANGDLLILGDAFDNGIRVEPGDAAGTYVIAGLDTESANGPRPTRVNGKLEPVELRGVRDDFRIVMRGGNDRVELIGELVDGAFGVGNRAVARLNGAMVVRGNARVGTGAGDDSVLVMATRVFGTFRLYTGAGNDRVQIGPAGCGACVAPSVDNWPEPDYTEGLTANRATIWTNSGNDHIEIANSSFRRELRVISGSGNDAISVSATRVVTGRFNVRSGAGNDVLSIGPRGFCACALPLSPELDFAAPGGISDGVRARTASIYTGVGSDKVGVVGSEFDRSLSILTGDDSDFVAISGTRVGSACHVRTGGGEDDVIIQSEPAFATEFGIQSRTLHVLTSSGNDNLVVTGSKVARSFVLDSGRGNDNVGIGATGWYTCLAPDYEGLTDGLNARTAILRTGDGDDHVGIANSRFTNDLIVMTGAGHEIVGITNTTVGDFFRLMTDTGDDYVSIGPENFCVCTMPENPTGFSDARSEGVGLTARRALITTGTGHDKLGLALCEFDRDLSAFTGDGDDFVSVSGTTVGGRFFLDTAADNDRLLIGAVHETGLEFGLQARNLTLRCGGGQDDVLMADSIITRSANVALGDDDDNLVLFNSELSRVLLGGGSGSDRIDIDDCLLDNVFADLGEGNDAFHVEQLPASNGPVNGEPSETTFTGPFKVFMRSGDDVFRAGVEGDENRTANFNNSVYANGGSGYDEFGFAADNSVTVGYTKTGFEKDWPPQLRDAGKVYVTDRGLGVLEVDPVTGDRRVISGPVHGSGPALAEPTGIAMDADGKILVTDPGVDAVFRVDPATGDRTIVSSNTVGSGPQFDVPYGIVVQASGAILVTDITLEAVIQIDPVTGDRTVISGDPLGANVGSGPGFSQPRDIGIEAGGTIVVIDSYKDALFRVDPATGNRTTISSDSVGSGTTFSSPRGLAVTPGGNILVADAIKHAVFSVDPTNGNRTTVASNYAGSGPEFTYLYGIILDASGQALVVNSLTNNALLRVDPATGNRTAVSSESVGSGIDFVYPVYLTMA